MENHNKTKIKRELTNNIRCSLKSPDVSRLQNDNTKIQGWIFGIDRKDLNRKYEKVTLVREKGFSG